MESLAFLVAVIFLAVVLAGPLALLFSRLGFAAIGAMLGVVAIFVGGYWACVTPFPVSLVGGISLICGAKALNRI
jgi:hypothetical protein